MRASKSEHGGEWGEMTAGFAEFPEGFDISPQLRGLPDDLCPCPHWGYVISGSFVVRYKDREETIKTGDAYYMAPGHAPLYTEKTEVFEVSPTEELNRVIEVVVANMSAATDESEGG
jgi:hypothetical protein